MKTLEAWRKLPVEEKCNFNGFKDFELQFRIREVKNENKL